MRYTIPTGGRLVASLLVLPLLAAGAGGCTSDFWGCDAVATCPAAGTGGAAGTTGEDGTGGTGGAGGAGGGAVCPEDTIDGVVIDTCGIWVSAALGDDKNPGTQVRPVRTIAKGIELADPDNLGPGRLYACGGDAEYVEWVVLPSGISIYGGFDCLNDWRYVGAEKPAVIHAPATYPVLTLIEGGHVSAIRDVKVQADDATEPGGSSIAVMALPGSKADFRRVEVCAGNGADGPDGEDGSYDGAPPQPGLPGNNGGDACTADPGVGGAAVITLCDGIDSVSGQGGDGNAIGASAGLDGLPADANLPDHGIGGQGEDAAQGTVCTGGAHGAHGEDGQHGQGADARGKLTKAGYFGARGANGEPGQPGQGGGGGGASLGANCGGAPFGGAGGGSGGSGGCGGKAGKGGQAGGSSIGIASLSDEISADGIVITTGAGGNGGNGGALQQGAQGGLPGYGGIGTGAGGAKNGCGGGIGGHGGSGGHGGGGYGGHSAAVAHIFGTGVKFPRLPDVHYGEAGKGGLGGDPDALIGNGGDGDASDSVVLDPG
jgi:hypothetical protein